MIFGTDFLSTITETATQSDRSNGKMEGDFLPGVILTASANLDLGTLYCNNCYLVESMYPWMRVHSFAASSGCLECGLVIRTASVSIMLV